MGSAGNERVPSRGREGDYYGAYRRSAAPHAPRVISIACRTSYIPAKYDLCAQTLRQAFIRLQQQIFAQNADHSNSAWGGILEWENITYARWELPATGTDELETSGPHRSCLQTGQQSLAAAPARRGQ